MQQANGREVSAAAEQGGCSFTQIFEHKLQKWKFWIEWMEERMVQNVFH